MLKKYIIFRYVSCLDSNLLYSWQSNPKTRQYFRNNNIPSREEHSQWLESALTNDAIKLLLGYHNNLPIGVIRFNINSEEAEVSLYLDPNLYGKGYGLMLLNEGISWFQNHCQYIKKIWAIVSPENKASQKIFEKAGFSLISEKYEKELGEKYV